MDRADPRHAPLEMIEEGLYRRLNPSCAAVAPGRPAVFLDRDGVLIEERDYLWRPEDLLWLPGAIDAVRRINAAGLPVVLVTNQAGIGHGYFDWAAFQTFQSRLEADLAAGGARLDAVYACAYHAAGRPPYDVPRHPWRKPGTGMLLQAAADLGLDLAGSWLVGDHLSDIQAALAAGLGGAVHVLTGHGARHRAEVEALRPEFEAAILPAADLAEAVGPILARRQPANN
jgi:D-glycero-D-manno-heptose 1,7-bisphosphate phosphatase